MVLNTYNHNVTNVFYTECFIIHLVIMRINNGKRYSDVEKSWKYQKEQREYGIYRSE